MKVMDALYSRRSIRRYKPDPVKEEDLRAILDCARFAPTAVNKQSWKFVAVTDQGLRDQIAQYMPYGKHIADAGACIAVFTGPDAVGPCEDAPAATTYMMLAAQALGYGTCWIGCHDNEGYPAIAKLLGAPQDYRLMALFSLGVPDGEGVLREKKPFDEVVSFNGF